jgi:hypothetical protein
MVALFVRLVSFALGCIVQEITAVALSVNEDGISNLLRREASTGSRRIIEAGTNVSDSLDGVSFYVLNLDRRREDKFKPLQETIRTKAPWMIERTCRVSAPDGIAWTSTMDASIISDQAWKSAVDNTRGNNKIAGGPITQGGVALIVGHALIWEHIVKSGQPFGVVMEDDITEFHPQAKEFLVQLRTNQSLQQGWDFLLFNECRDIRPGHVTKCQENCGQVANIPIKITVDDHAYCTGMYVIKSDAAQTLLKSTFPINNPVQLDNPDGPMWGKLRGAYTLPSVVGVSHEITDVQKYVQFEGTTKQQPEIPDCPALEPSSMVLPALLNAMRTA